MLSGEEISYWGTVPGVLLVLVTLTVNHQWQFKLVISEDASNGNDKWKELKLQHDDAVPA